MPRLVPATEFSFCAQCLAACALLLTGCPLVPTPAPTNPQPSPVRPLRLWVVAEPALAEAITRQWRSQSETELRVEALSAADFAAKQHLAADAVLFPASDLPRLVHTGAVIPLNESQLNTTQFQRDDLAPLTRDRRGVWGRRTAAVAFGEPPLLLVYNRVLLEQLGRTPPATWAEFHALAKDYPPAASPPDTSAEWPAQGAIWPTAAGWPARLVLARAAAGFAHRAQPLSLVDVESLQPLVASEPFVEALEQIASEPQPTASLAPEDCFWKVARGEALLAIAHAPRTLPTGAAAPAPQQLAQLAFAELPGAPDAWNALAGKWEPRGKDEDLRVPFSSSLGLLGGVTRASPQPQAAQELLVWLSSPAVSSRVFSQAAEVGPFRTSHAAEIGRWLPAGDEFAPLAASYAAAALDSESHSRLLTLPRCAGAADWLAPLDQAVSAAIKGEKSPAHALAAAADAWRKILGQQPPDELRRSLRQALGLEEWR